MLLSCYILTFYIFSGRLEALIYQRTRETAPEQTKKLPGSSWTTPLHLSTISASLTNPWSSMRKEYHWTAEEVLKEYQRYIFKISIFKFHVFWFSLAVRATQKEWDLSSLCFIITLFFKCTKCRRMNLTLWSKWTVDLISRTLHNYIAVCPCFIKKEWDINVFNFEI